MKLIIVLNSYGFRIMITRQWIGFHCWSKSKDCNKVYLMYPEIYREKEE